MLKQDIALNKQNGWYTIKPNQIKPNLTKSYLFNI